jgi:4-carboxymuconolactone decarboxylase
MLGFDAARPAARPGGCPFFLQPVENFLHVASLSIMREIASPARRRQIRRPATCFHPALGSTITGIHHLESEDEAMAESELHRNGAAMRRQLMGDAAVERSAREIYSDPVMKKFIDVATETVFGALWTRPGLDLKTRALICVVSDAATGREPELGLHLRMALRQGWTEEELTEVLLHLSGYVGVPIIRESMMVASKAFADFRAEKAAQNP